MKTLFAASSIGALFFAASAMAQQVQFQSTTLTAGMHKIKADVAANDPQRQQGLMFREKMDTNTGMVFVFERPEKQCMWMKNTPLPLSVAFIDEQGKIVNIEDMAPHKLDSHCSTGAVKYALEMNVGWFKQRNIKPGMTIGGLATAAK